MPKFEDDRNRVRVTMSLSVEAIEAADTLADDRGMSRSGLIESLIRAEADHERLDLPKMRKHARKKGYAGDPSKGRS